MNIEQKLKDVRGHLNRASHKSDAAARHELIAAVLSLTTLVEELASREPVVVHHHHSDVAQ
jgi:hypothetical protein